MNGTRLKPRDMGGWILWAMVASSFLLNGGSSSPLCPKGCTCDNDELEAACSNTKLDVVPHFLNPRIKTLDVSNNRISRLDQGTLSFYVNLRQLDLSFNQIRELKRNPFQNQRNLNVLNLTSNYISNIVVRNVAGRPKSPFHGPVDLQTLDLSGNNLTVLRNHSFSNLKSLVILTLASNFLYEIESMAFEGLQNLRTLHLESNKLTILKSDFLSHLQSLRFLYISGNNLLELSADSLRPLVALRVFDVSNNLLQNISSSAFEGTRYVDTLNLAENKLKSVPSDGLSKALRLKSLDLSANPIVSMESSSLQNLHSLETLMLNNMPCMEKVSGLTFSDNSRLSMIQMENNHHLNPLPYGVFDLNPLLSEVSFVNNSKWRSLSPQQIPTKSLVTLKVSGIPFFCNCSLLWLWDLYQSRNQTEINLDDARCTNLDAMQPNGVKVPSEDSNLLLLMSPDQLVCSQMTTETILVIVAAVILVFVCILLVTILAITLRQRRLKARAGSSHLGSPCIQIKDDTMIYNPAGYSELPQVAYNGLAATTSPPEYQKFYHDQMRPEVPQEPFYEVPKFCDADGNTTTSETEPKSSTSNSSKYSSSGYIGSELWEPGDYLSTTTLVSTLGPGGVGHCYTNPHSNLHQGPYRSTLYHQQLGRNLGSPGHSSSGLGSDTGSSTASAKFKPVFFSPQPRHNTMVMRSNQGQLDKFQPTTLLPPQKDLLVKYSGANNQGMVTLSQLQKNPKKKGGKRRKDSHSEVPDVDLLTSAVGSYNGESRVMVGPGSANHYV